MKHSVWRGWLLLMAFSTQMAVAADAPAAAPALNPDDVVANHCAVCHNIGLLGAPKIGNSADWQRVADARGGLDGLLKSAISGVNAMPPKGACNECSDADLKAAIQKMSGL